MKTLIELKKVNKVYQMGKVQIRALNNVNLRINKKEFTAIMGPSGSGKSTLLNMIGLLDRPTSGKVFLDGVETSKLADDELARIRNRKIGFVFQFFNLLPNLTALKNVELPMIFAGIEQNRREKKAKELLKMVGLRKRISHKPTELSGGEIQRVAIARAMANNPEIILADEPTGNLDSKSGKEVMKVLAKLNKERKVTLVIVTHEKYIAEYAKRIIRIVDGRIVGG
jgi:putative ABC transport system ATP-binding protein